MNTQHVIEALQFLSIRDNITLYCVGANNISLIRREVLSLLGTPRKTINNTLWYAHKSITIDSFSKYNLRGTREDSCFYVSWARGTFEEEEKLERLGIVTTSIPYRSIQMWQSLGMCVYDMYKALLVDGYDEGFAKWILLTAGVISASP